MSYKNKKEQKEYLQEHFQKNKAKYGESTRKSRQNRRKVIADAKSYPCADCGLSYPSYVMDFDHRDGETKSFGICAKKDQKSISSLLNEIEKCDVVCSNCHRVRTHNRASI